MPDQDTAEQATPEARAEQFASKIKTWQDVSIQGQLGDGTVEITQKAPFRFHGDVDPRYLLKIADDSLFIWAGTIGGETISQVLSEGYLVAEGSCYMRLTTAYEPENEWIWR
ncbi:hypothetical protein JW766_05570 [Candidatus Dojkabacteria bacterium]|nr:hypothetical protein [Candidatus Dojkabacteria bacterium]